MLGVNIKFTSAIFIAIFLAGIFFQYLILNKKRLRYKFLSSMIISFIVGFAFLGYDPYVSNIINYGSPFFPYLGEVKNTNKFFKNSSSSSIQPDSQSLPKHFQVKA